MQNLNNYLFRFFAILLILSIISVLGINFFYAPYQDDFCVTVFSVKDAFMGTYGQYMEWNGRVFPVFFQYFFSIFDKSYYIIVNIIFTCLLFLVTYRTICGRWISRNLLFYIPIGHMFLWFFMPAYGEVFAWRSGTAMYLWSGVLLLAWFCPFRQLMVSTQESARNIGIIPSALFFCGSVIIGTSFEISSFAYVLMGSAAVLIRHRKGYAIPKWAYCGLAGLFAGWLVLINAPGIAVRAGDTLSISFLLQNLPGAFGRITLALVPIVAPFSLFLYVVYKRKKNFCLTALQLEACFYILFAIINAYGFLVSPQHSQRAFAESYFIALLAIACLLTDYMGKISLQSFRDENAIIWTVFEKYKVFFNVVASMVICVFLYSLMYTTYASYKYYKIDQARSTILQSVPHDGTAEVIFPQVGVKLNVRSHIMDTGLAYEAEHWKNICYAKCKGLKSVRQQLIR